MICWTFDFVHVYVLSAGVPPNHGHRETAGTVAGWDTEYLSKSAN